MSKIPKTSKSLSEYLKHNLVNSLYLKQTDKDEIVKIISNFK